MGLGLYNIENPLNKAAQVQHGVGQTLAAMDKATSSTTTTTTQKKKSGLLDVLEPVMAIGSIAAKGFSAFSTGGLSLLF